MNEAGVKLLLHTTLTDVIRTSDSITKLILTTKAGLEGAQGKIFIDATGDGDLIARADEEYVLGSEPNVFDELVATGLDEVHFEEKNGSYKGYEQSGLMQPVSMMFTMGGADVNKCRHLCNKKLTFADLGIDSEEFKKLDYLDLSKIFFPKENGKYMLDLREVNRQILIHAGVLADNIDVADLCTCCLQGIFHSHRATGGKRGTLALMIGII